MQRHKSLSLREPQAISLSKLPVLFNYIDENTFFSNLKLLFQKLKFDSEAILNTEDADITTI